MQQVDVAGNVWAGVGDGVLVYAPDGELLGAVAVGEVSNLAFAGDTLIMLQARPHAQSLCCKLRLLHQRSVLAEVEAGWLKRRVCVAGDARGRSEAGHPWLSAAWHAEQALLPLACV